MVPPQPHGWHYSTIPDGATHGSSARFRDDVLLIHYVRATSGVDGAPDVRAYS